MSRSEKKREWLPCPGYKALEPHKRTPKIVNKYHTDIKIHQKTKKQKQKRTKSQAALLVNPVGAGLGSDIFDRLCSSKAKSCA